MKKVLSCALVVCIASLPFLALYSRYIKVVGDERINYLNLSLDFGELFSLPPQDQLPDQKEVIQALIDVTLLNRVNIYKFFLAADETNQFSYDYFVLMSQGDSTFFDHIPLRSGQYLTSEQTLSSEAFLSSIDSHSGNQVGVIESLGNSNNVNVYPLFQILNYTNVSGTWVLECNGIPQYEKFIKDLRNELVKYGYKDNNTLGVLISGSSYGEIDSQKQQIEDWINFIRDTTIILLIITGFIVCYIQVQDTKASGKMTVIGKNIWQKWFDLTGKLVILTISISSILCLGIACLMPYTTRVFLTECFSLLFLLAVVFTLVSMVTLPYLYFVSVSDSLKNRSDSLWLVMLISFTKFGLVGVLLFFGINATNHFFDAREMNEGFTDWRAGFEYGGLTTEVRDGESEMFSKKWQEVEYLIATDLYQALSEERAIYVNVNQYSQSNLELEVAEGVYRSMKVNPNYLKVFPILDQAGQPIQVEETETDWVILVPEKLKNQETSISDFFQFRRTGRPNDNRLITDFIFFGVEPDERFYTQKVKILWIENNQEVFGANPEVFPQNQGRMTDPIIEVMTLENSLAYDRFGALGSLKAPLKVELKDRNPNETYKDLLPILQKINLEDKITGVELYSDSLAFEMQLEEFEMKENFINMLAVFILFLILIFVSVLIFFAYEDRKVAVQKLLGYGLFRRHWHYLVVLGGNWGLITLVFATGLFDRVFHTGLINEWSLASYLPMLVFFVVEVIVSGLFFLLVERLKVSNVLKGA